MATNVHIKNFQSIKDLHIKIDGFTVLIGKNNIGKSAVIRAIKAALDNQTGNKAQLRRGEDTIEVQITRPEIDFKWSKGDETFYEVTEVGKEKEVFAKLNGAVPEPLIKAGFDKISINDKMENPLVASQFKELFILDQKGSVVTEVLTDLYDIDIITIADEKCQKDLKSNKSQLKTREADLKTLQAGIDKYKGIEAIKESLKTINEQEKLSNDLKEEIRTLLDYEKELNELTLDVEKLKDIKKVEVPNTTLIDSVIPESQWLNERDKELIISATSFKKLKGITKVKIPKIDESLASELEWILNKEQELSHLQSVVDQLKKVEAIKSITVGDMEKRMSEVAVLKTWDEETGLLNKRLSKPIPKITGIVNSVAKIEDFVQNLSLFTKNEQDLKDMATSTKIAIDELKVAIATHAEKKKELDSIKACPLCDRPFHD